MKELGNKIIAKIHWMILIYGAYTSWIDYDEHSIQLEDIVSRGASIEAEITNTQKKLKQLKAFAEKSEEYKKRVEEVAIKIETVQKQLPAETNDSSILTYFQSEIKSLNIREADFVPGKEEPSTYFIAKEYGLKAQGTFLQFLIFLERLSNSDRIYNVKELKLILPAGSQKGRFLMISGESTIQAYRYNPDFKVDRGF